MNGYKNIEQKLHQFTRKYYTNEFIKGVILFLSFGLLYLFFTLFLEYFLWLRPKARTFVFWIFIAVEIFLLIRFIAIPIFKLIGIKKGISLEESSRIIGNHFPEVKDKLLNILQLKGNSHSSDLILASIDQKSKELQPIPFVKAIDFNKNSKYLKYAVFPLLIWLISLLSGINSDLSKSFNRIVNPSTAYLPPAPFYFVLENTTLDVIQGKSVSISVKTLGSVLPNEALIHFENQQYYLQNKGSGNFSYTFTDVENAVEFYIEANGVRSEYFNINIIKTPTIHSASLEIIYPNYINKQRKKVANIGNIIVPEGSKVAWKVVAKNTDSVTFINKNTRILFKNIVKNEFQFSKRIRNPLNYQIASSNINLQDYEKLQFNIDVIKDQFPVISINTNIDSLEIKNPLFVGQISDDYGIHKLQLVYYNRNSSETKNIYVLETTKQSLQTFMYQFPDSLQLDKGVDYEFYFQVFDNDAVNGNKQTKSKIYNFRNKTDEELDNEQLQEQRNTINNLENSISKQEQQEQKLQEIQQDLTTKKNINWSDKKKIQNYINRQNQYKKMMQRQTDKLEKNLEEKTNIKPTDLNKKEELKERIQELKKQDKLQKLLDEIEKMATKLNKEDLLKKAKELAQQNKQQERSLERILELTKRFYVEQKTMQIANKIDELAKKQESLHLKEENNLEDQKDIKKEFDKIKDDLKELAKDNKKLKEPMELPDVEDEKEAIEKELKQSEESLKEQQKKKAKESQKKSAEKIKEMSAKMQQAMLEMEGESMEENLEDLRKILENLVTFSFKQESLMNVFEETSSTHPNFGDNLKKQHQIKTYFEHIDDSLYVLSMRLPKISAKIQDDLSTAHYNLELSLDNFSENRFLNGISNQRYVITASNNLSDYLSNILNSMKNSMSMKMGKGKGKGSGFSLPDLIKKQAELSDKMKQGMKKGQKPGEKKGDGKEGKKGKNGKEGEKEIGIKPGKTGEKKGEGEGEGGSNEDLDGELYEIYKQQSQLRQQLQEAIKESENANSGSNESAKKVLKTMEQLENDFLEKGFNAVTLQKMQNLNYQLLKLEKATLEQDKDKKRKSKTNQLQYQKNSAEEIKFKKLFLNQTEILNRQSLPLQQNYKKKVREYFSEPQKKK